MQKDVSQSIISIMKPTSKSVVRSQKDLTESKKLFEQNKNSPSSLLKFSKNNISKRTSNQLKWVQKSRQSIPFRLQIHKITNLPSISKKSNSSILFLHFTVKTYLKKQRDNKSTQVQMLGQPCHYQCQQSLFKREQSKYEYPVTFYYHSRISKNQQAVFLSVGIKIVEMRTGFVQSSHNVGFFIVENPFAQNQERGLYVCKEQINDVQYVEYTNYKEMSKGSQGAMIDYEIVSAIELKKLTKLVPQNTIITTHSQVVGTIQQYLSNELQINEIIESSHLNLKFKYLQVHIPNSFQESILSTLKSFPNALAYAKDQIKARKIIFGLLSGKNLINPQERKLEFLEREDAGEFKVSIYQGLKDGQFLNYHYYVEETPYPVLFCLVYEINDKEVQSAYYPLSPIINGQSHDLSEEMIMNPTHDLSPISRLAFVKSSSKHKPTIIAEYVSEQILMEDESFIDGMKKGLGTKSSQSLIRSSHKLIQDKAQQMKQKQKLMQDIEYQKMCLEKERNEIEKLKNQNYVMYQEEFQRRFEIQKQALARRQEMLENQYREQVQRQIREKYELQEQIKEMKEKVMKIEQQQESRSHANQFRPNESHQTHHQVHIPGSFMNTQHHRSPFGPQTSNEPPFMQRQKIDPSYLIQTQNTIPVTKVRELIHTKSKIPVNKQLIEQSKNQYHRASKFTFTFTSVAWNQQVAKPQQLYFVIRFFNFGQYRTDRMTYLGQQSEQGYCQLVRVHQYNCGNDNYTPNYTFTVDPSQFKNPKTLQSDLVAYLSNNNCIIDIFDGSTHIYLGQFNIKLSELLRGSKSQIFIAKEYNLVKIKTKEHLGVIQVVVKHEEAMCKNELFHNKTSLAVKQEKKKVISYAPMVIPKQGNNQNISGKVQKIPATNKKMTQNRAQQRIKQFKQRQQQKKLSDVSSNFTILSQHQKQSTLASISEYKQKYLYLISNRNINEYIKTIYSSLLHENISINAQFGKAETFPYTFVNQSTTSSAYKIVIDWNQGNRQEKRHECDLEVVKQASQWRYYVKKKGYMQPKFYEIINDSNVFYLNPGEHLTMVFKYLTFKPVPKYNNEPILINVSIVKIDSNWIAGGFSLTVDLHEQIVHHSYVLYEPGSQLIQLVMPVIYTREQEYGPGAIKKLYITDNDQETQAQWLNEYEILLKVLTPEIMQRKTFNILLYDDEYFDQLKENWLIIVNSYEGVWAQCRLDYSTKIKLALPMSVIPHQLGFEFNSSILSNYLKLNGSDNSIRFQNGRILAEFSKMREGGAFEIWCQIVSTQGVKKQIQVTCTSQQSSGLIYGWIVQVFPYSAKRN